MKFVKKNLLFIIVLALTVAGSCVLIFMDWKKHNVISAANTKTRDSVKEVKGAFSRGNKPVEKNILLIRSDAKELRKRTAALQRLFGKPYRKALLNFAKTLYIGEDELYQRLRDLYNDDGVKEKSAVPLVRQLLAALRKDKKIKSEDLDAAYIQFVKDVQTETREKLSTAVKTDKDILNLDAGYEIFACALGLPRTMNATAARVHLKQMQRDILEHHDIPGVADLATVRNFTFNQFVQGTLSLNDVNDIFETLPVYEDIFRRMSKVHPGAKSGNVQAGPGQGAKAIRLGKVEAFSRSVGKAPGMEDKYKVYSFSTKVTGPMDAVRNFVNDLLNAYKENRVYVVTGVSIVSPDSAAEVEKVRARFKSPETGSARSRPRESEFRSVRRQRRTAPDTAEDAATEYGRIVIGASQNVTASIDFDYYVFIGDRLVKPQ